MKLEEPISKSKSVCLEHTSPEDENNRWVISP